METMVQRRQYQPHSSRRYASRRHKPGRTDNAPKPNRKPIVLFANSIEEFNKLRREYPNIKITMDPLIQTKLFDDKEYEDV